MGRTLDMGTLARNMRRPGMDTRIWASRAVIRKMGIHPDNGAMADILLLPSRIPETAQIVSHFGGDGWGQYCPYRRGDEVAVIAPSGDPGDGLTILGFYSSKARRPPAVFLQNPNDYILYGRPNYNVRTYATGKGSIILTGNLQANMDPTQLVTPATLYPQEPEIALKPNSPLRIAAAPGSPIIFCASSNPSDLNPTQRMVRGDLLIGDVAQFMQALNLFFVQMQIGSSAFIDPTFQAIVKAALGVPGTPGPLMKQCGQILSNIKNYLTPNLLIDDPAPAASVPEITAINGSPASISLQVSHTQQAKVIATMNDGSTQDVTQWIASWTTSNGSKATVSPSGLISAVAAGSANITATMGTFSAVIAVTVTT